MVRTKGVREDQPGANDGSFSPTTGVGVGGDEPPQLLEGGEGPRRRTEDQLDTNRLKMVLFLARCRDPGL